MLDEKEFLKISKELEEEDKLREYVIVESRKILKHSKKAINHVHNDKMSEAKDELDAAKKVISSIEKSIIGKDPKTNSFRSSLEEYAEGLTFYHFVKDKKILTKEEIGVKTETYLLGLSDLTGELGRRAVYLTTKGKYKDVKKIYEAVVMIYDGFLNFSLRNGELRKKYDSIKWNLKKIEEILYDLKIRDKI